MDLSARRPGPDVVRAIAMAGVVMMNYHGYLIIRGARRDGQALSGLLDPWTGPLSTRFAATFVLTAGVGVTLMTRSSIGDAERTTEMRWRLVRRGLLLYSGGMLFDFVWAGTVLPFYGVMFMIAAGLFTLHARWLALIGGAAALAGWLINWWVYERSLDSAPTTWLTDPTPRSPRGLVFDVFVNGTHPLLPWLVFFCAGMIVGRLLSTPWWRPAVIGFGFALYSIATVLNSLGTSERSRVLLSDDPFDRGLVYVASALGTALLAFGVISWIADQFAGTLVIESLRRAGQMSLTIYLGHALLFNLVVDWLDLLQPRGLGTALTATAVYWFAATALSVAYQRRYGRGPVERLYRRLSE